MGERAIKDWKNSPQLTTANLAWHQTHSKTFSSRRTKSRQYEFSKLISSHYRRSYFRVMEWNMIHCKRSEICEMNARSRDAHFMHPPPKSHRFLGCIPRCFLLSSTSSLLSTPLHSMNSILYLVLTLSVLCLICILHYATATGHRCHGHTQAQLLLERYLLSTLTRCLLDIMTE